VLIVDGTRVGDVRIYEGPMQSVIKRWRTGGGNVPAIFSIQNTVIGRSDTAGPQGKGFADEGEPMFTLDRTSPHAVATPIQDSREVEKEQNGLGIGQENDPAFTVDTISRGGVQMNSVVRRLTPMECELLQGFPPGWTDGQADSQRYKQMGNAVAVPVVSAIIARLVKLHNIQQLQRRMT
jgi:site-specific DNA-cytosine methylase